MVFRLAALLGLLTSVPLIVCAGDSVDQNSNDGEKIHWAFRTPTRPAVPVVKGRDRVRNPIDAFVLRQIESIGANASPEADRATLLRRLRHDLTGLPPAPVEIRAFLDDTSPEAYERLVDRLLASPEYGERWAQHWLDLARYADSDGFEFDQARPNAWRYRDWVVQALNEDMPYHRFLQFQLAGDEIAPEDSKALVATGFCRCYPDMVDLNDQGLRRQNALNDITETTALVFLGLTIGCARCHDHKFDPIPQTDFYQLQAIFGGAAFRDDLPLGDGSDRQADKSRRVLVERSLSEVYSALVGLEFSWRGILALWPPRNLDDQTEAALGRRPSDRSLDDLRRILEVFRNDTRIKPDRFRWFVGLDPTSALFHARLSAQAGLLERSLMAQRAVGRVLFEEGNPPAPTRLLIRGDYATPGPVVEPDVPQVLRRRDGSGLTILGNSRSSGRRSALARWLSLPAHPLTARVMVNRLWQRHFGRGIVATTSDFGAMGDEPTHPELLDWLAVELIERGGRLKEMHRLMVTSTTYRQASITTPDALAVDPENLFLARQRRTRLDGEAIRDALLVVGNRLSRKMGGPAVFPELPAELMKLSSKGDVWPISLTLEERSRRSLYVFVRRNLRYPFFEAFDRPDTNASCPERVTTTIAPQALTLLNSQLSSDAARAFADRLIRESAPDPAAQVRHAFLVALGRSPGEDELADCLRYLETGGSLRALCLAILNTNEFVTID